MACYGRNIYSQSVNPSKEFIDQVARQMAARSVRDTDFVLADGVSEDDYVAIVQGGTNKKVTIRTLLSSVELPIKIGTTNYWNNLRGYIPDEGTIIVYTDYGSVEIDGELVNVPAIKIGSGNGYVQDLAFLGQDYMEAFDAHVADMSIHTTAEEKTFWNRKLNVDDAHEVLGESLIFNRH